VLLQVKVIWLVGFASVQLAAEGAVKVANVGPAGGGGGGEGALLGVALGDGLALGDAEGLGRGLTDGLELTSGVGVGGPSEPRANSSARSTMTAMSSSPPMTDNTIIIVLDFFSGVFGGVGLVPGAAGCAKRSVGASAA
jgi:hypothetical protein